MNRLGLVFALGVAILTGLAFGFWPDLDLRIAALFFDQSTGFKLNRNPLLSMLRDGAMWIVAAFVAPAFAALLLRPWRPRARLIMSSRAAIFLILTLSLGPGLLVNVLFKDHWHRPRPWQVAEFGGPHRFTPWWSMSGGCARNCSFVAGEASGAYWTLAPAALAPPAWRAAAYAGAIGFGAAVGLLRMSFGAHFFTDVVFAGVLTFLLIWIAYGVMFRWRGAISAQAIDGGLNAATQALRNALASMPPRAAASVGPSANSGTDADGGAMRVPKEQAKP